MKTDFLLTDICLPDPSGDAGDYPIKTNYCIAVQEESICHIGPASEFNTIEAKNVINGHGQLALPGLINGHCHAPMTLFRGLADDLSLADWLNEHIFPAEAKHVTPDMVYWCSKLAAAEMILSGTTTVADSYFHEHHAARAFADVGLRAVVAQGVIDFPAPGVPDPQEKINHAAEFLSQWRDHPLVSPAVFAHSPYTCSSETLVAAKELARSENALFFIHVAETEQEAEMIQGRLGDSPVRHIHKLGILDSETVCIHAVWLDEQDLDILAETGVAVVVCPQSNLKLASGTAPLQALLARGIRVGIGTDGAASNNRLDLIQEMDICAKLHKLRNLDPVAVPVDKIINMATRDGASVLGLQKKNWATGGGEKSRYYSGQSRCTSSSTCAWLGSADLCCPRVGHSNRAD
ncbi:5-methylthioadenosine/S-adenosylhomocysteine deaminase [Candidatus Electrothrix aarhusensis]|uniref:5-methylthioadenosine/S-adenosylhomocysteine deaminase n=1 Tax=Candidatus Electrothrix aarhusensis TaxID=1859131 RepID=A0A3S3UAZ0_9BACT|nr:5-methylthioadenosine/S-adenosylhomocysteine deaminase [Candidatus Electrothrix aarhusensis]